MHLWVYKHWSNSDKCRYSPWLILTPNGTERGSARWVNHLGQPGEFITWVGHVSHLGRPGESITWALSNSDSKKTNLTKRLNTKAWLQCPLTKSGNKSQQYLAQLILLPSPATISHHRTTTVLRPFFRDHPGEPVPEENFWTLWCNGRLIEADTLTIRLGATQSGLTSAHLHHPPIFLQAGCLSCHPTNSVKALKVATVSHKHYSWSSRVNLFPCSESRPSTATSLIPLFRRMCNQSKEQWRSRDIFSKTETLAKTQVSRYEMSHRHLGLGRDRWYATIFWLLQ